MMERFYVGAIEQRLDAQAAHNQNQDRHIQAIRTEGVESYKSQPRPIAVVRDGLILDADNVLIAKGVAPGMSLKSAKAVCDQARYLSWSRERFEPAQRAWLDRLLPYAAAIEPLDQHIAVVDLSPHPDPAAVARLAMAALGEGFRFGAAASRWLAVLACRLGDPHGLALSDPAAFLAHLSIENLTSVSPFARQRLRFLGYGDIGSVTRLPLDRLVAQFGCEGWVVYRSARGEHFDSPRPLYPPASVSARFRFQGGAHHRDALDGGLAVLARRLGRRLRADMRQGWNLALWMEGEEGETWSARRTFGKSIRCERGVWTALRLLAGSGVGWAVSGLSAWMTDLEPVPASQSGLEDRGASGRSSAEEAMRSVQAAFGERSVRRCSDLPRSRRVLALRAWKDATGWD